MLRNIVGPPARGNDFYDREELVSLLWERLETNNVLLAAPRRFGKTSLMYQLLDQPRPNWKPVHVDAESIREPVNFIIALLDALLADRKIRKFLVSSWKGASGWIRGLLDEVELATPWDVGFKIKLKEKIQQHWEERAEALLHVLRTYGDTERLLIIIDELPVMLLLFQDNNVSDADARAFLYWFRRLRTDPRIGLTNSRFLVGGSIGIEHHLSTLDASDSFNDFQRLYVGELHPDRAADFLKKLLKSRGISASPAAHRKMLDLIGVPIPYFLQAFVDQLATEKANGIKSFGPKRLEQIYEHRLLGPACKSYFQYYYDRLRRYEKAEEQAAKALLKELALAAPRATHKSHLRAVYRKILGSAATEDGFGHLLGDLENDFYIHCYPDGPGYGFASKVLCDWWRATTPFEGSSQ